MSNNTQYLKEIAEQLSQVPRTVAKEIGLSIFIQMLDISINESGFDSGQAAANWIIEGYRGSPSFQDPQILWGFGDKLPVSPVGYKTWYTGGKGERGGDVGDKQEVYSHMFSYANAQIVQLTGDFQGVVVYNPIVSGFAGFEPGDDKYYEENALSVNKAALDSVISKAVAVGEANVKALFNFLR